MYLSEVVTIGCLTGCTEEWKEDVFKDLHARAENTTDPGIEAEDNVYGMQLCFKQIVPCARYQSFVVINKMVVVECVNYLSNTYDVDISISGDVCRNILEQYICWFLFSGLCTSNTITSATIEDGSFPLGYDNLQFDACLDNTILKDNLAAITEKVVDTNFQTVILKKLNQVRRS